MMPNFFIVGAARSGTTSLDRYLDQHPEIYLSPRKEMHFFAANYFPRTGPGDERLNKRVIFEANQYTQIFAEANGAKAVGESSVFYLCLPGTADRIAEAVPNAKIIIVLREPVDRAYSAYLHLVRDGREHLEFEEALSQEEKRKQQGFEPMWWYKEVSLYYQQVKQYLDVFGRQNVKVLVYDELFAYPDRVLRDVFAFLAVSEDVTINTSVRYNVAGVPKSRKLYTLLDNFMTKPGALGERIKSLLPMQLRAASANKLMAMMLDSSSVNPQIDRQLRDYFTEDVGKLEELLHKELLSWHYQRLNLT
jgi:hypothetical protein